ncbi:hypothetical protein EHP00_2624 [Ecytonucleospora hepatopenaei]|uniref:Uncharacterized protein n=1 Tax=Ecytonucleospora hepatopenaei TaxID=646526 RepID=A0A1W0E2G2_9MICR|nr:hypothetical protein EHP00_2624 [Ecytonucleospora hepatopenaei]
MYGSSRAQKSHQHSLFAFCWKKTGAFGYGTFLLTNLQTIKSPHECIYSPSNFISPLKDCALLFLLNCLMNFYSLKFITG